MDHPETQPSEATPPIQWRKARRLKPPVDEHSDPTMTDQKYHQLLSLWMGTEMLAFNELDKDIKTSEFHSRTLYKSVHIQAVVFDARPLLAQAHELCASTPSMREYLSANEISQSDRGKDTIRTSLCSVELDENGWPKPHLFALAPFIWGMQAILNSTTRAMLSDPSRMLEKWQSIYKEYIDCQKMYQNALKEGCEGHNSSDNPSTLVASFLQSVADECLGPLADLGLQTTIVSEGHHISNKGDSNVVGSFVMRDLLELSKVALNDLPHALRVYLEQKPDDERIDVRQTLGLRDAVAMLDPTKFPISPWPSDHGLAFSQQLAINAI